MNSAIGVYDSHDLAVEAVKKLKASGYPIGQLSIMGLMETEEIDEQLHVLPQNPLVTTGISVGTVLGTTLGILTGVGLFAIPGVGFLFGAGALVGAIAGFDIGIIGGGIATALATVGVKDENEKKYHDALAAGKYLVIAHGNAGDVEDARALLSGHGTHDDIAVH
jgi:hypothetical protein